MRSRAEAVEKRREQIYMAAASLFAEQHYDDVTLQGIAERAGVSLKTVVRQFGSKEAVLLAGARYRTRHEDAERAVEPGDVGGAVRVLATRYEAIADLVMKRIALEERVPAIREAANIARAHHTDWLATVFARWLPRRKGAKRTLRLMALFGATEIYVWWSWRLIGLSPRQAQATMREMVEALLARWSEPDHGRGDE
ncbi:MAG: TetR/AcrR family transcriptional regulator [Deltaproteobacteria bacterium]|nr:TetR/AcrR family transcriptional regulator [Deltaproteobacteria bacterium]